MTEPVKYTQTYTNLTLSTVDSYLYAYVAIRLYEDGAVQIYSGDKWVPVEVVVNKAS